MQSNNDARPRSSSCRNVAGDVYRLKNFLHSIFRYDCPCFLSENATRPGARYLLRATAHIAFFHPVYSKLGIPRFLLSRSTLSCLPLSISPRSAQGTSATFERPSFCVNRKWSRAESEKKGPKEREEFGIRKVEYI